MRIVLGSDHAGFLLKQKVSEYLKTAKYNTDDIGTFSEESVDYPDFAIKLAEKVSSGKYDRGILFCGTGIGVSITANKVRGIRAALVWNKYTAEASRLHNNANIICIGGRTTDFGTAKELIDIFLKEKFAGGRHRRRINKITEYENGSVRDGFINV